MRILGKLPILIGLSCVVLLTPTGAAAASVEWYGTAGDGDWSNPANWVPNQVPVAGDDVIVPGAVSLDVAPGAAAASLTVEDSARVRFTTGSTLMIPAIQVKDTAVLELHDTSVGADVLFSSGGANNGFVEISGNTVLAGHTFTGHADGAPPIVFAGTGLGQFTGGGTFTNMILDARGTAFAGSDDFTINGESMMYVKNDVSLTGSHDLRIDGNSTVVACDGDILDSSGAYTGTLRIGASSSLWNTDQITCVPTGSVTIEVATHVLGSVQSFQHPMIFEDLPENATTISAGQVRLAGGWWAAEYGTSPGIKFPFDGQITELVDADIRTLANNFVDVTDQAVFATSTVGATSISVDAQSSLQLMGAAMTPFFTNVTVHGELTLEDGVTVTATGVASDFQSGSTVKVNDDSVLAFTGGGTSLYVRGTLDTWHDSSLNANGVIIQTAGSTLARGALAATEYRLYGGTMHMEASTTTISANVTLDGSDVLLSGQGSIAGFLFVKKGTFAPFHAGTAPFDVDGQLTIGSDGTLRVNVSEAELDTITANALSLGTASTLELVSADPGIAEGEIDSVITTDVDPISGSSRFGSIVGEAPLDASRKFTAKHETNDVKLWVGRTQAPTVVSSTSHTVSTASNDPTIDMTFGGALDLPADTISTIAGYSYAWTNVAAGSPDGTIDLVHGADPHVLTSPPLSDGSWYLHLRAIDSFGNASESVHAGPYVIDVTPPPAPTLSGIPAGSTTATNATITISSEAGSTLACTLDGAAVTCGATTNLIGLGIGAHVFRATATDVIGNVGATASATWTITAPTTTTGSGTKAPVAPRTSQVRNVGALKFDRLVRTGMITVRLPVREARIRVGGQLRITRAHAKRLGLRVPKRSKFLVLSVNSSVVSKRAGSVTLRVRLTRSARNALKRASAKRSKVRSVSVTMQITLSKGGKSSRVNRRFTLRR